MTKRTIITVLCGFFAFCRTVSATGMQYPQPVIEIFHPLGTEEYQKSLLTEAHPSYLIPKTTIIDERQVVDFEQRAVAFERVDKTFGVVIWQYRYDEMDNYINDREKFVFGGLWGRCAQDRFKAAAEKKKAFNPLQMQLNIQYPSWAQRILGKDPPRLSITGYEELIVAYEYNKTDAEGSNYDTKGTGGISFDQNNQFTVTGSVGKVINVNIKASTKSGVDVDASDPFKNFKIEYKGEGNELEDEVVQEVLAGSVSFQMPGASLAGYSESHKGLLGLEVKTKFGPLELTGIASQERGEAQTTTFDLSSGSSGNSVITEKQFVAYKMFFLDTMYRNYYLSRNTTIPEGKKINRKKLQIWLHTSSTLSEKNNVTLKTKNTFCYLGSKSGKAFKLLTENTDYTISDLVTGCIRFDNVTISETDEIGICMATVDSSMVKGDTNSVSLLDTTIVKSNLWMLKNENPKASDSNFVLAWRNVYSLSSDFDVSKFKLSVKRIPESGDTTDRVGSNLFSYILGLTDNTGAPYSTNNNIYDQTANLLIIPRFAVDSQTWSNRPFSNIALNGTGSAVNINPGVDTLTDANFSELKPMYNILMSGSSKKSTFQLGSGNIEENSEKITGQDGEVLKRDEDYSLEYQYGTLQLTSKKALAKTKITVEYQSEALFIPKSKTFLGLHGEMKLPFGQNSFIGGSLLYQDASSSSIIPKIGQEPYSKFLLDANTKMNFEPQWMTGIMDIIPFLNTEDKSTASIDMEVAHSRTNPNTDGQAYIDDFESSNKSFDFPLEGNSWYMAAPPVYLVSGSGDSSLLHCPPAWTQWWYQPLNTDASKHDSKVFKDSILFKVPSKSTYTAADKYEATLNFECQPAPSPDDSAKQILYQRYRDNNLNPWAGITYPIPTASMNRSKDKYLEFYARGDGGRLYIDLGEVSEDICNLGGPPNGETGDEDTSGTGSSAFNNDMDIGVDGLHDTGEYYLVPNATMDGWDTLKYGNTMLPYPKDPARDNFQTYSVNSDNPQYLNNYPYANGTELNGQYYGYDSKDLLGDGLATSENYFRRFIDFDSINNNAAYSANNHNYQVLPDSSAGNAESSNGWHLYRIPLNDSLTGIFSKKNSPLWTRIKFLRFFWTDFNDNRRYKANRIQFARMRLVRNEWQEHPIKLSDSTTVVKMTAKTINTEDNPEYTSPPGFSNETDESGNRIKESALDLTFSNIKPGDTAMVKEILVNETINLSEYTTMSMSVHGDTLLGHQEDFQYFFRFGNNDSTYYEYRAPLYSGWDNRNKMIIDLHDFSSWKLEAMRTRGGSPVKLDTTIMSGTSYYSIKYRNSTSPNFAGITWMAIGVMRSGEKNSELDGYYGDIWVDELKLTGIHKFNGWATRTSVNTSWAGFMNLSGKVDYTGADFLQMTTTDMKLGSSSLSSNAQVSWSLNKFLPSQWGFNIPLGTSFSGAITRPSLVSNSDIYLTDAETNSPDGFMDMYADAINLLIGHDVITAPQKESRHYQTGTISKTFYTGFDKSSTSKNPIVNFMLERLSLDYNYNYNLTQTARGKRTDNAGEDYIDSTETDRYTGNIKYDLSPRPAPEWTKWKPFDKTKLLWLPDRVKNYELSLLPSTINFTLADVTYNKSTAITDNAVNGKSKINTQNFTLQHNANIAYEPINILKMNYTLDINRNLDNDIGSSTYSNMSTKDKWISLMKNKIVHLNDTWHDYYILQGERDRTQNATLNFDPTLWDWLTCSFDYSSAYKQTTATLSYDSTQYLNLGVISTFHLTTSFTIATLFKNLSEGLPNLKAMSSVFKSIEKGLGKVSMNSFTLNYNATMNLTNNYVNEPYLNEHNIYGFDFLKYQMGLSGRNAWDIVTGSMDDNAFGGMKFRNGYKSSSSSAETNDKNDTRTADRSYSASTSFSLPEPIGISFNTVGVKYSRTYTIHTDVMYRDTTTTWPEINVGANSQILNKIKLITNYMNNIAMNSSYNFQKKTERHQTSSVNDTITGLTNRFSPLIGINGKIKKWPINVSYSHIYNSTLSDSKVTGKSTSLEHSNKVSMTYEIQKSSKVSEFKLLLWTIPLKGTFNVGIDAEQGNSETAQYSITSPNEPTTKQESSNFSFSPHTSYTFSDNITGNLSFSASNTKKESVTTTSYIFKLSVNIALK